ncbi:unnamed protein product [Alternaria alternata]
MSNNIDTRKIKSTSTYHDAVAKGKRLLNLTVADVTNGPSQSQFQDCGDLEEWGWGTFTIASTGSYPSGDLIQALSTNPESFPPNILTVDPETLIAGLPKLRYWSDVAFLQWKSLAPPTEQAPIPELKIVVRYAILNLDTRAVCNTILASLRRRRQEKAKPGVSYDKWFPRWPGTTFPIASEEAKALCGTPNGTGVLWLLAQHKVGLGCKTVDKVTMFYRDESAIGLSGVPTLIFYVKDVAENSDIERVKNMVASGGLES